MTERQGVTWEDSPVAGNGRSQPFLTALQPSCQWGRSIGRTVAPAAHRSITECRSLTGTVCGRKRMTRASGGVSDKSNCQVERVTKSLAEQMEERLTESCRASDKVTGRANGRVGEQVGEQVAE